jgi:sialate O-acetylesterase
MNSKTKKIKFLVFVFFISISVFGQVRLPKLISDGMVLQRDSHVKIWGWSANNEKISVSFCDSVYQTTAGTTGEWAVNLSGLKPGGPFAMTISASNSITIKDIMIGDVWLCSGQSNMEYPMERLTYVYETEIAGSDNPCIRHFKVPGTYNFNTPQNDLQSGTWESANPKNVLKFSAVAYFFARKMYDKYHVPIGLINSSMGGLPAESMISEEAIKEFPNYYEEAQRYKDTNLIAKIEHEDNERIGAWYKQLRQKDEGYRNALKPWYDPDLNISDWNIMKIPGYWANGPLGDINGVVWFRKDIIVPKSMTGIPAKLILGNIIDADSVFVNGIFAGTTGYKYPHRRYDIPSNLLREGKNTIVVRVISNIGKGGFVLDKTYEINSAGQRIDLSGDWKYKLGTTMEPLQSQTFIRWKPVGLYNAMISPLLNYTIKGVIWYQGESNADRPFEYHRLFPALINDWRKQWNDDNLPFIFVQLPNFMERQAQPSESNWALFREAQLKTLSVSNTAMAVAIDIGEWNDIHPLNKKDVGIRLALAAQKAAYGDTEIVASGPLYQSMKIDGNKIILTFTNTGSGLAAKGGELKYFAIAGADKQFVWAKARIENNLVIVWSENVPNPIAVRYAWADNPEGANLYNNEGLPASPFRTDEWITK